jgi:Lon protease-like protein
MEIPLFPLRSVLFPGGPLLLRIFETRYLDMIRHCLRTQGVFGVVLIEAGEEVGPVASTASLGTSARIVDFNQRPDGLLGIVARGERRFQLLAQRQQADGLRLGSIDWLPEDPPLALPAENAELGELLRRALPELGEQYEALTPQFDDAFWVGYRLAEILPLAVAEKQQLLELVDPLVRLTRLASLVRRESH